jgi:PAS domain S-box-containing protein
MKDSSTILIVDDHLSSREILRDLLKDHYAHLALAKDGEEALAKAVELMPDLILLDVMLPGLDGFEVCARLRTDPYLAEVPIIMITALDDRATRQRGLEAGVDDFISKPFDTVELLARIKTITRLNRYRRLMAERTYRQQAEEELYRRNYELTLLNQVMAATASTLDGQDILYLACEAMAQAFDLPQATALLLDKDSTRFVTVVEYLAPSVKSERLFSGEARLNPDRPLEAAIPFTGLISEYLLGHHFPLAIVDDQKEPALAKVHNLMRAYGLGSLLVVPILMDNQPVAMIELGTTERRYFTEQDLTFMHSIARVIGQAMETAQLYQDRQDYIDQLEEIVAQRTYELKSERDQVQAMLKALGEAVIVTDTSGMIEYLNPAAEALTGFSEAELIGQHWCFPESQQPRKRKGHRVREQLCQEIATVVGAGQVWRGEVKQTRKDGAPYDALLTVAPLFDPDDPSQVIRFISVQSDITPLKEAEQLRALYQERDKQVALDRLRHTFLSTVNHELRTPLALIFQTIELLENTQLGDLTPEQLDAVMALHRQARVLGQMVEGLTRVAAFLSKQEPVRPVPALLAPVFQMIIPVAEYKARPKQITIDTEIPPDLPALPIDVKQIEEALTQLLDNAIKFNPPGGKVRIEAQTDETWVIIAITDTGIGIEAEQLSRMWEPFEQGADPLQRAQEGLGLGLALAHHIVAAHRGHIEVESTPGQGSTFKVKLPRAKSSN